jgi:hypothetical protein
MIFTKKSRFRPPIEQKWQKSTPTSGVTARFTLSKAFPTSLKQIGGIFWNSHRISRQTSVASSGSNVWDCLAKLVTEVGSFPLPFTLVKVFRWAFGPPLLEIQQKFSPNCCIRTLPPTLFIVFSTQSLGDCRIADSHYLLILDLWSMTWQEQKLSVTPWGLVEKKMSGARGCFNCGACASTLVVFFSSWSTVFLIIPYPTHDRTSHPLAYH